MMPDMPRMKTTGKKTTMVVRVLAMIAPLTSPAPLRAASIALSPFSR